MEDDREDRSGSTLGLVRRGRSNCLRSTARLSQASRHHDGRLLPYVMSIERYVKTDSLFLEHITHAAQIVGWRDAE